MRALWLSLLVLSLCGCVQQPKQPDVWGEVGLKHTASPQTDL